MSNPKYSLSNLPDTFSSPDVTDGTYRDVVQVPSYGQACGTDRRVIAALKHHQLRRLADKLADLMAAHDGKPFVVQLTREVVKGTHSPTMIDGDDFLLIASIDVRTVRTMEYVMPAAITPAAWLARMPARSVLAEAGRDVWRRFKAWWAKGAY